MAFDFGFIQKLKGQLGFNAVNVGAEAYVLNGYAAMFDAAIAPYMVDQGSSSTTVVPASSTGSAVAVAVTVAANPIVSGAQVANIYGNVFTQGAKVVVDVGPQQETNVVIMGISGLVLTLLLANAHGQYGSYPVLLQGGEYLARQIMARIDVIEGQLTGIAPITAGVTRADDVQLASSMMGRKGQLDKFQSLNAQRDLARKELASLLGVPNLWEMRGKFGGSSGSLSYEPY